ncbi:Permease of the drug/metabolite transporter (DMT) superfamily [Poseidonocella pacifica]|uniref:Permease of the drug/metabolite transporter (DMT) superfamily n=1 Tax=Poseidonocella pacifica TaxID=871651 RepID=A0A1I0Y0T4_9RHOB|nr:DMT family transporter [Poseidonocella pacifica]SFB06784.1 Permease of the drug/metabolite transporter (DMT) superfamily [Poseidonocella pacifica]
MGGNTKGSLQALLAFAIFSTHDVIVKLLGGTFNSVQIIFFSVLLGFPLLTIVLMRDATQGTLRPVHPWWMALRTCAAVLTGISAFYAFSNLPMAQVYAIIFAAPLLITLLAIPILGETVHLRRGIAILVGLVGVFVVLQPSAETFTLGHLAALSAAVSSALASVIVRKVGGEERGVVLLLYPMMANCLVMGALLPVVYRPMTIVELGLIGTIALFGLLASRLIIAAYRNGEAAIVAPMQYSQILWATLYGSVFFDEGVARNTVIGATIIIASGLYIVLRESRGGQSENKPVLRTRLRFEVPTTPRLARLYDKRQSRK